MTARFPFTQVTWLWRSCPALSGNISWIRFRDNGLFEISVDRLDSDMPEAGRYLIRERVSSSATRNLHLLHASGQGISAELLGGLLYVVVPKASYHWEPEPEITIR